MLKCLNDSKKDKDETDTERRMNNESISCRSKWTYRQTCRSLFKRKGHEPLALIRDEKQADALKELGAAPVIGNLEKDVTDAVKQADAVIFAAGSGSKQVQIRPLRSIKKGQNASLIQRKRKHTAFCYA